MDADFSLAFQCQGFNRLNSKVEVDQNKRAPFRWRRKGLRNLPGKLQRLLWLRSF